MDPGPYLPLALALFMALLLTSVSASARLDRIFGRIALRVFGRYVRREAGAATSASRSDRKAALRAARRHTTYRMYAAKTLLYATLGALSGSIIAVYLVYAVVSLLNVPAAQLRRSLPASLGFLADPLSVPTLSVGEAFALFVFSSATIGVLTAAVIYQLRWWRPRTQANARARQIDASIERTVAFLYALSRSGMSFPEVMRIVVRNQDVYGEAATEFEVVVREIDLFGADLHEALQQLSERTPSDEFGDFCDNLGSVLRSGRDLGDFLRDEHEQYQAEAEARQRQFLDLLGTVAEGYVTVFVAGPLFLLTILMVVGLITGGTKPLIAVIVYFVIPLATVGILVYLDSLSVTGGVEPEFGTSVDATFGGFEDIPETETESATDGGVPADRDANEARLDVHRRTKWATQFLADPVAHVLRRPETLLAVTVPLSILYVVWGLWPTLSAGQIPAVTAVDDLLVHGVLFVGTTFTVAYEARQRQLRAIERAVPDFLDRLASVNEAGMPIAESFGQVVRSDVGALNTELARTWTDVEWGARIETALARFDRRVRSAPITRAVTLITNALRASGDVGPVLRIAADEANAARRLARERRQEMLTYSVVIYISFFVFLAIVVSLNVYFVPSVPTAGEFGEQVGGQLGNIGQLTEAERAEYQLLFFHASLVQAVCSGLVAGQMGENSISAGAKHATGMLLVGYGVFVVLA
ncbi:MAG: type II secretion system F family protein [Halobacteriaceae archaeon]